MSSTTRQVRVTSFHAGPAGGGILLGMSDNGDVVRARIGKTVLPRPPAEGECWRVTGTIERIPIFDRRKGRTVLTDHIAASFLAPLIPSGDVIQYWIAANRNIKGVGRKYAARLWEQFGPRLYELLKTADIETIATVLDLPKAMSIVDAFGLLSGEIDALARLDRLGVDGRTANAAIALFGEGAAERLSSDPYALTLLEPWTKVDATAMATGMLPDDERRLLAAVDNAAAAAFRTTGHNLGGHTVV